jgi:hypothetical protein
MNIETFVGPIPGKRCVITNGNEQGLERRMIERRTI